jgi:hypothetical protein
MKIKAIITGSTGMVGEGVLQECLSHQDVEEILVINRRPCGVTNPKLTEIIHPDFFDISPVADKLKGYNACFFCLGVSSVGMSEEHYYNLTYTLTLDFARLVAVQNPDMTFCYVSGAGTDSSEKGRMNWARVKGKTENDLMKLSFKKVFACRPGFMLPAKGAKNVPGYFKVFRFLYPVLQPVFPNFVSTLQEVALAMINSVIYGYEKNILEVKDLVLLAKR